MKRRLLRWSARLVAQVGETLRFVPVGTDGLRVTWHRGWDAEVDAAACEIADRLGLDDLELHRLAGRARPGVRKRHAVVRRGDDIVAVLSLRRRGDFWEPVTSSCLPMASVLCALDDLGPCLRATRLYIRFDEVPADVVSRIEPDQSWGLLAYRAELGDHEEVWRSSRRFWRNIRNVRNRTAHLAVRCDDRDDVERIVDLWADEWADDARLAPVAAPDMVAVYEQLYDDGSLRTVALLEDERIVGGAINAKFDDDVVYGLCMARNRDHPVKGLGTRVVEEGFGIAAGTGATEFDLLGGLDYKRRWAPVEIERHVVEFIPAWLRAYRRLRGALLDGEGHGVATVTPVRPVDAGADGKDGDPASGAEAV